MLHTLAGSSSFLELEWKLRLRASSSTFGVGWLWEHSSKSTASLCAPEQVEDLKAERDELVASVEAEEEQFVRATQVRGE